MLKSQNLHAAKPDSTAWNKSHAYEMTSEIHYSTNVKIKLRVKFTPQCRTTSLGMVLK